MNLNPIDLSASGMRAQRLRMDLIAGNLANVDTTSARSEAGRHVPYARRIAVFTAGKNLAPVARVTQDCAPFRIEHNPTHPHAGPDGNVAFPNVHPIAEMVDMISASRAYEANVSAMDTAKAMAAAALRILA